MDYQSRKWWRPDPTNPTNQTNWDTGKFGLGKKRMDCGLCKENGRKGERVRGRYTIGGIDGGE